MDHTAESCQVCKQWAGTLVHLASAGHFRVPLREEVLAEPIEEGAEPEPFAAAGG